MGVTANELSEVYPLLYHMASVDAWPTIEEHGLLSTSALLDLYEVEAKRRASIETEHRPHVVRLEHPRYGAATIRDQHPMSDAALLRCLTDGLGPAEWYQVLNRRVFFWLTEDRLERMLKSPPYVNLPHLIIVLRTESVLRAHWDNVWLAPMNTGCTVPFAHARGPETFRRPSEYPWRERQSRGRDRVVELTVEGGVLDVKRHLVALYQRAPLTAQSELF